MLKEKLKDLTKEILEYAGLIETMIDASVSGLINKDSALLNQVIVEMEPDSNNREIEIDELCTTSIAQYEPKAKNLRTILMFAKINNDLERIGDHAVNIAESGLYLIENIFVKPLIDTPRMAEVSISMLKDSVTALIDENILLARDVCERDNIVDGLKEQIIRELVTYMTSDPSTIERALQLIKIAMNLERIADLSTNICEDVIFMVEGKNIKHRQS